MKSIKNKVFLLLFLLSTMFVPAAFALGKRVWTFDYKKLNLPEYGNPLVCGHGEIIVTVSLATVH